jgi:hypothetical protein
VDRTNNILVVGNQNILYRKLCPKNQYLPMYKLKAKERGRILIINY